MCRLIQNMFYNEIDKPLPETHIKPDLLFVPQQDTVKTPGNAQVQELQWGLNH